MSLISRRSIQDLLDEDFLTPEKRAELVHKLNGPLEGVLPAEWELIVLSGLARVGTLTFAAKKDGAADLDVLFDSLSGLKIAGEVTVLSDDAVVRRNPIDSLIRECRRRLDEKRIRGTVEISLKDVRSADRYRKIELALPAPHEFRRFVFNDDFEGFTRRILKDPNGTHALEISNQKAQLKFVYCYGAHRTFVYYPEFQAPRDLVRNPLFNRLKAKSKQIKRAALAGGDPARGILVCDGGSSLFRLGVGNAYSFADIAKHFLRQKSTLDFIGAVSVTNWLTVGRPVYAYKVDVYERHDQGIASVVREVLSEALATVPLPIRLPVNAANHLRWRAEQHPTALNPIEATSSSTSDGEITLSARACIDYVAGRTDRNTFELAANEWMLKVLRKALDEGSTVQDVAIRHDANRDDDELIVRWTRDPATTDFE